MNAEEQSHDALKNTFRSERPFGTARQANSFGAGTLCSVSVPVGSAGATQPLIPAVPGLTAACKKDGADLGEKYVGP
jgi:hypothetical protein